jgi:hypothetical protein
VGTAAVHHMSPVALCNSGLRVARRSELAPSARSGCTEWLVHFRVSPLEPWRQSADCYTSAHRLGTVRLLTPQPSLSGWQPNGSGWCTSTCCPQPAQWLAVIPRWVRHWGTHDHNGLTILTPGSHNTPSFYHLQVQTAPSSVLFSSCPPYIIMTMMHWTATMPSGFFGA